jgi:hypothetical protein
LNNSKYLKVCNTWLNDIVYNGKTRIHDGIIPRILYDTV